MLAACHAADIATKRIGSTDPLSLAKIQQSYSNSASVFIVFRTLDREEDRTTNSMLHT